MSTEYTTRLEDFGTRSLLTHAIMAVAFVGAILGGLFVDGQLGLVAFVSLLGFAAGAWVVQSIHSLGNARTDDTYTGILSVLLDTTGERTYRGLDTGRLARLLTLIAAVTAVSLLTAGQVLTGMLASIGIVAIGSVALITAMVGFLIALGSSYDASERKLAMEIDQNRDEGGAESFDDLSDTEDSVQ